jgi:hypothetical protein
MPQTKLQESLLPAIVSSSSTRCVFSCVINCSKDIFSRFNNIDLSRSMLADCCVPQCRAWGTVAAVGRRWPPWSGCVFLSSFHLGTSRVTPKTAPKPTQNQPLSHLISPSIIGGWGWFKQQSSSKTCWQASATRCHVNSILLWRNKMSNARGSTILVRCVTHHGKYGTHSQ